MKVFKTIIIIFLLLSLTANKCEKNELPSTIGGMINRIEQELMVDSSLQYLSNWHIEWRDRALVFGYFESDSTGYITYMLFEYKKQYFLKELVRDVDSTFTFPVEEKNEHIKNLEIQSMNFVHIRKVFEDLHLYSIISRKEDGILMFSFTEPLSLIYSYLENKDIGQTIYKTYTPYNEHWFYIKRSNYD